jgi:hypothetical protein
MGQLLNATENIIESWVETTKLAFCTGYKCANSILKIYI